MSVEDVENHLNRHVPLLYTREYTLEKGLMSVLNVGNHLPNSGLLTKGIIAWKHLVKGTREGIFQPEVETAAESLYFGAALFMNGMNFLFTVSILGILC
jgi:hypothetical protein